MCLKRPITAPFERSEPFHLLRLNGRVGAIPTYRVYRLYDSGGLYLTKKSPAKCEILYDSILTSMINM